MYRLDSTLIHEFLLIISRDKTLKLSTVGENNIGAPKISNCPYCHYCNSKIRVCSIASKIIQYKKFHLCTFE